MACRDSEGNLVSADSVDALSEYSQEMVPEENVCLHGCMTFFYLAFSIGSL